MGNRGCAWKRGKAVRMNVQRILLVEDEKSIQVVVRTYLENAGFQVFGVEDGPAALAAYDQHRPVLVILDLNLPGMDGMEVAARLRERSDVYIMILTARSEEDERIAGLRIGADDYLVKPFSPRELVARVEALLRRRRGGAALADTRLEFEHLRIDPDSYEAWAGDTRLELTPTEFKLLLVLAQNPGRVLTRDQLVNHVWGADYYGNDRVVDVYVGQVRRKVEQATAVRVIETVRGVGYKFSDGPA